MKKENNFMDKKQIKNFRELLQENEDRADDMSIAVAQKLKRAFEKIVKTYENKIHKKS